MRKRLTLQAIEACEQKVANADGSYHSTVFGIVHPNGELLRCIECIDGDWVTVDKPADIYTAEKLERAVTSKKRFVVIIGGRGSMKSVGVVDIMLAGVQDRGDKVYCLREYQSSISQSVHALNKSEIKRLKLDGFKSYDNKINHKNGGSLEYMGLSLNPESIKSAAGFRRFFSEESAKLSDKSITNLTPTARNEARAGLPGQKQEDEVSAIDGVQMFFVGNPGSSADPFSKRFIVPFLAQLNKYGFYEDELHLVIKMNYTDNPWFADSGLEEERQFDFANKSRAKYDWIWLGAFLDDIDNSIIEAEWFDACVDAHIKLKFQPLGQEKIAFDPADSGDAKAMAYQHGCVVLGVTSSTAGNISEATEWAIDHVNRLKPDVFLWDDIGVGAGIIGQLHHGIKGKKIKIVPFGGSDSVDRPFDIYNEVHSDFTIDIDKERTNAETFRNLRAQCYWALRDRMFKTYLAVEKGHKIPNEELISFSSGIGELAGLRAELCRIPRKFNGFSGRIQIMSKPEMKKLGIQSPNMADAVMMLQKHVDIYEHDYTDNSPSRATGNWA